MALNPFKSNGDEVALAWTDLSVYAVERRPRVVGWDSVSHKRIINSVYGEIKAGTLVALMGSSGSGKSTLLEALADRSPPGMLVEGEILVNGSKEKELIKEISGFIYQDDLFGSCLTVREHLTIMAHLKLDRKMNDFSRKQKVLNVIRQLGLCDCADTLISTSTGKNVLSNGEKKRLSFATELLSDPLFLFCDEPTTALDAFSAETLVEQMRWMVSQRKTVLCSIHQPSSHLFEMFDHLILLAEGRVAFMGKSSQAMTFFSRLGYQCPMTYNPADFFIQILSVKSGSEETCRRAIRRVCNKFLTTCAEPHFDDDPPGELQSEEYESTQTPFRKPSSASNSKSPFWISTLYWLTYRSMLAIIRDPNLQVIRIIQKLAIAVMAGLCFKSNDVPEVKAVQGALFILVSENTFSPMYATLADFPLERPLFQREHRRGLYPTHLYYLSKIFATLPGLLLDPLLFVLASYWLMGLSKTTYAVLMTILIAILTINVSTACGCFFSTAFDSVSLSMTYLIPFDYIMMITSGVFIQLSSLPTVVKWMQYISWFKYSYEAMSIIQWKGVSNITCVTNTSDYSCLQDGEQVLQQYSFSSKNLEWNLIFMILLYLAFHSLAFICLWYRTKPNSHDRKSN